MPIRATVGEAWRLLREHPAQILLPALVVTAPVSALVAITLTILRLTAFENEPLVLLSDITSDTNRALAFALVAAAGVEVLFGQVARGATVVAVASVATGRVKSLVEALDPAFTRMGAIISLAIVLAALGAGLILSVVGIAIFPFVAARFALSTETLLLEGRSPTAALASSWAVTRGRVLRLLGAAVIAGLFCLGPLLAVSMTEFAVTGDRTQQVVTGACVAVAQAILLVPVVSFLTTVMTLFYLKAKEIDGGPRPA